MIGFSVHAGCVDGATLCCMFNKIISHKQPPLRLSSDNDPLFLYQRWQANLRIYEIEEIKTIPYTPISHPFIERLIGTIRRELLDHTLFWNTLDLERKLTEFQQCYNQHRTHSSLNGHPPAVIGHRTTKSNTSISNYQWRSYCRGLFHLPVAA